MAGCLVLILLGPWYPPAAAENECQGFGTDQGMCMKPRDKNVLGGDLALCCDDPVTGAFRNGFCQTNAQDAGTHVACATVTDDFLAFTRMRGSDLVTPRPEYDFPGLKQGDRWCLCASRWVEAFEAGAAPPLVLEATHQKMLEYIPLDILQKYADKP